jgi:hypothetical protein
VAVGHGTLPDRVRATVRTAAIGAVIVLGSTAAAQGAMAKPAPSGIVTVPCNTPAPISALSAASYGEKLQLAFGCSYELTAALPTVDTDLTIVGFGATLERSEADGTPDFTILTVDKGDLNLVEVDFRNGRGGSNVNAGAIDIRGGNITVLGGTFTDNGSDEGGAIYNGSVATVIGTTFTRNSSGEGAALFNIGHATLSSITVQNNSAYDGGGIYNMGRLGVDHSNIVDEGSVTLSLTGFSGNTPDNCEPAGTIAGCSG